MPNPVTAEDFEGLIGPLGPFEAEPMVAVAVSGGRDSMALAFLCGRWARGLGGKTVLLTVDHGLRAESADEAAFVAAWAESWGIGCHILRWEGEKPSSGVQEAARTARYALMEDWCRANGVLHLFLAHHRDDQDETLLMRLSKGSGQAGLAAMAPVLETRHLRLVRPLLGVPRARLEDTLRAEGIDWVEDPSNRDAKYERTRMREITGALKETGLDGGALSSLSENFSVSRRRAEEELARLIAARVDLHPAGFAYLSRTDFSDLEKETAVSLLGRLLRTVGGMDFSPPREKVERLLTALATKGFKSSTLGRCRVLDCRGGLVVIRENRNLPPPLELAPGRETIYDRRFYLQAPIPCRAAPLGVQGWQEIAARSKALLGDIPPLVRSTLPAFWDDAGVLSVPPLRYWRDDLGENLVKRFQMRFCPPHPLCGIGLRLS